MCIKVFELYVKIFFETYLLYVKILGRNSGDCFKASLLLIFCTPLVFNRGSRRSTWNTLKYHFSFLAILEYHLINWEFNNYILRVLDICIGCIIAKTNIHDCDVGYYVPICSRHLCKLLDMMFQHLVTAQCVLLYAWLYAHFILLRNPHSHILLTKQRVYLFRISCVLFLKEVTIF